MSQHEPDPHSPERLQQALRVVRPRSWYMLVSLGVVTFLGLLYLTFGRIPVTAEGRAFILTRDKVVPFHAPAAGQLTAWKVAVGDHVEKGAVLALVSQPAIQKKLDLAREQLNALKEQNQELSGLTETFSDLELRTVEQKAELLGSRIASLTQQAASSRRLSSVNYRRKLAYFKQQESDLQALRDLNEKRSRELQAKLERYIDLREKRLRSTDAVLEVRRETSEQRLRLSDIDLQLLEIGLNRIKTVEAYQDALDGVATLHDSVASLAHQLAELASRKVQLEQQGRSSDYRMLSREGDLRRRIASYEDELERSGKLVSEHTGRVLELSTGEGQLLTRGEHLGTIDTRNDEDRLEAVVYFTVRDGKKLRPGMKVRLAPATVERARFGSLLAEVAAVSSFPISPEGAAKVIGVTAVAQALTKDGHQIQVVARLKKGNGDKEAYAWDLAGGPGFEIASGTVARATVNVEEKPPVAFVIPALKGWSGF